MTWRSEAPGQWNGLLVVPWGHANGVMQTHVAAPFSCSPQQASVMTWNLGFTDVVGL